MRESRVRYKRSDGVRPTWDSTRKVIELRNPMGSTQLSDGSNDLFDAGLTFDVPVMVLPARSLLRQGVGLKRRVVILPGEPVVFVFKFAPGAEALIERDEVVAYAVPLFPSSDEPLFIEES